MKGYCIDCQHLEERPRMAETYMDIGVYVKTCEYFRCKKSGRIFNQTIKDIDFQVCTCDGYEKC